MSNQKDDKYKNCFKSQADMWAHLLKGKPVRCVADMKIYELEDGNLHTCYNPNMHGIWEPYEEPKWYENIPPQGVLCWAGHDPEMPLVRIAIIESYDRSSMARGSNIPFVAANGTRWRAAVPLTFEEAVGLVYKPA